MFEIAVVGMGCRFPGGAAGPEEFWEFLLAKGDGISEVPADRWSLERFYDPDPDAPGRMYTRKGGFLTQSPYEFDPEYFGISPREAAIMDPQQRLILEVAVEALDDAGLAPRVGGRDVGVYVGGFTNDNQVARHSKQTRAVINSHTATSGTFTMLSNRLSFVLDLRGPSMTIDTACSSSLVALNEAAQAVARGECELALAGGVNAMLQPETFVSMCKGRFLAPDGYCKTFDAAADGYSRGEGAGVVVLKPLAAARADGDRVYAVLRATGANQDGRTSGITVPNPEAQAALARRVLGQSGLAAADIGYVEAHGTGTSIGDPLEIAALGAVYGAVPDRPTPLLVGSVKNSIGHLEAAAGVASVIKTALTLHHAAVAPQAFLRELNPAIPFAAHRIEIPVQPQAFPDAYARPAAAVNGFGYGGTNAHAVLVAADPAPEVPTVALTDAQRVFPVSGRTEAATRAAASALADRIEGSGLHEVERLQGAAWGRRLHHPWRVALGWDDPAELATQLRELAAGEGRAPARAVAEGVAPVFVFSGMGPQWWAMARALLNRPGPFADTAAEIDAVFEPIAGWSIVAALQADEADSRVTRTEVAQPANFLVQVGLVAELAALGITPSAVLGHSVGEVSAAYVSGALDLHDALLVSCHRARLQATTAGTGGMLAVGLPEADALDWIAGLTDVCVAAVNSPSSVTLAGDTAILGALAERLAAAGIFARALRVEVPYHSHLMDPILEPIRTALDGIAPRVPTVPLFSSVTAAEVTGADWGAAYWVDNVRQPVRFAAAAQALLDAGHRVFTEVGPHPVLSGNLRELLVRGGETGAVIGTLSRDGGDVARLRQTVAELYAAGALGTDRTPGAPAGPVPWADLPRYPWQRSRLWTEVEYNTSDRIGRPDARPLLGQRTESQAPAWEVELSVAALPWLPDHVVDDLVLVPGAAYVDAALSAAAEVTGGPGQALADLRFVAPLILDVHDVPVLRLSVEPATRRFTIDSRSATETTWTIHAVGRIVDGAFAPSAHDLGPAGETVHVEAAELYANLADRGLRYGPAFQGVQEAWVGSDRLVARVEAAVQSATRHLAHPATTDAALQCLAALVAAGSDAPTGPVVPYAMASVRRHGPLPAEVTVAVRRLPRPGLHADLALAGPDGQVALELLGVEFRPVRPETSVLTTLERIWYAVDWERLGTPATAPDLTVAEGPLLVVGLGPEPTPVARELLARHPRSALVQLPADAEVALASASRLEVADAVLAALGAEPLTVVVAAGTGEPADLTAGLLGAAAGVQDALDAWLLDAGSDRVQSAPVVRGAVITEQAFGLAGDVGTVDLGHGALIGVRRTLRNEQPDLLWRHVDGEPGTPTDEILGELLRSGDLAAEADEVVLRGGLRLVAVLRRNLAEQLAAGEVATPLTDPEANFAVEAPASMLLSDLALRQVPRTAPGPRSIEVRTTTAGVNYKDPAKVIGLLTPAELAGTHFGTRLGMESVGTVVRVGAEVTEFAVGDRVGMGVRDCLARFVTLDLDDPDIGMVRVAPPSWTDDDGATNMPFLTAHYGLIFCAQTSAEDVVLVHGAAGGVGMAGVQVAKSLGARVIATAGSPERRAAALAMGADHVLDSRSLNFVAEVRALTDGRGVDVVLSSAPGEVIGANLAAAAEFGRIVEVGKSDVYTGGLLALAEFDRNLSFRVIDIDRLFAFRRSVVEQLVTDVKAAFMDGRYRPLPETLYPVSQVSAAMEAVARASHIGRVSLDFRELAPPVRPPQRSAGIRADATYLITGGFGTFGLATAAWLAEAGARHLVLVGRSGATTDAAKTLVQDLARAGVEVQQESLDITVPDLVTELVARIQAGPAPLAGVFHAAGVLDDRPFTEIDGASLRRVMGPKVDGARLLDEATLELDLDHFVLYSSATAIVGAVPQTSYSAANATLDALAQRRRAEGRPALSVNWGMLSGDGMASSAEVQQHLASIGLVAIDLDTAARMIGEVLALGASHIGLIDADWKRWGATHPQSAKMPRVAEHVAAAGSAGSDAARLRAELLALEPAQRTEVVGYMLAEQVAVVLGIPAETIDLETALPDLGLDSLMAVELQARVNLALGVEVSALEFSRGGGLAALADRILPSMVAAETVAAGE